MTDRLSEGNDNSNTALKDDDMEFEEESDFVNDLIMSTSTEPESPDLLRDELSRLDSLPIDGHCINFNEI